LGRIDYFERLRSRLAKKEAKETVLFSDEQNRQDNGNFIVVPEENRVSDYLS